MRKVDQLGRVVIPKELRRVLEIEEKDPLEIFTEKDRVILKKYTPAMACTITSEVTANNKKLADGRIVLSPNGAKILLNELEHFISQM